MYIEKCTYMYRNTSVSKQPAVVDSWKANDNNIHHNAEREKHLQTSRIDAQRLKMQAAMIYSKVIYIWINAGTSKRPIVDARKANGKNLHHEILRRQWPNLR